MFVLGVLAIVVCTFNFYGWVFGVVLIGILNLMIYGAVQVYLYIKNDFEIKPLWEKIN